MLKIRRYQPQDNKAVKELHYAGLAQFGVAVDPYHDSDLDDIENIYINNHGDFLVGLEGGEIVAMGAIRKVSETCGEIKRIRVRQDCQRRGYGQTILLKLMEIAAALGYTELRLDTVAHNTPARRLFEMFGFTKTHRGKVGDYELIFYGKRLNKDKGG
jgi:ribosomal protein S18 acetylase RimI-like enzyme